MRLTINPLDPAEPVAAGGRRAGARPWCWPRLPPCWSSAPPSGRPAGTPSWSASAPSPPTPGAPNSLQVIISRDGRPGDRPGRPELRMLKAHLYYGGKG